MMRGQKSLYNDLFPTVIPAEPDNKGKRNVYLDDRDDAIACRYYFYAQIIRKPYEDCLLVLKNEFFLSPNSIAQRLTLRTDYIKTLVKSNPTRAELRKRYPHLIWSN